MRNIFAIVMIGLCVATIELAMRYMNWPRPIASGWRTTAKGGPINQFGWRGQATRPRGPNDFVVVLTGAGGVECLSCPADETLDATFERALRPYNPNVRVITLGSTGYSQDQEYLALKNYFAHERADLVIAWVSIADDVPANMFRSGHPRPGQTAVKPTFALFGKDIRGPTEEIGQPLYRGKIWALLRPLIIDPDRNWASVLPKPDPGTDSPAKGIETVSHVDDLLEQQRTPWAIWLTPRPARVKYGIELTRALFRHMHDIAALRGARFAILLTPSEAELQTSAPLTLEHAGHWFVADPAARNAAIAEVTDGLDTITLPPEDHELASPEAEQRIMARLAEALNERNRLTQQALLGPRR
ncbi:MAG: hypothetical protein ABSA58_09655 [Acetobacteraceae bacterium]|jgi:hypothetical protein